MKNNKIVIILAIIFLLTLTFRLYFTLGTDNLGSDDAYLTLRYSEKLMEDGLFRYDELSYGGREVLISPLYYYILIFFSSFMPLLIAIKVIPEIFFSLLVILIYLISFQITRDKKSSLIAALMVGFVPFFIGQTLNQGSIFSLTMFTTLFMLYSFMNLKKDKKHLYYFIGLSFILPLIHPSVFIFIITLIFYSILLFSEGIKANRLRVEAMLFSMFLTLLIQFIILKNAFLEYGANLIWQNIPDSLLKYLYININVLSLIYGLGLVTLVFGVFGIYYGMFKAKRRGIFLFSGLLLAVLLLLLLRLIEFELGMIFFGATLPILASLGISRTYQYIKNTKFAKFDKVFSILLILLIIIFSIYPSFVSANEVKKNTFSNKEVEALEWIKENTEDDSIILASVEEGHIVNAIANRKNVVDGNFLLIDDAFIRLKDVEFLFVTWSEASALDLLRKYKVDHIYLSERGKKLYDIESLKYVDDKKCFKEEFNNVEVKIYEVKC